MSLAAMLGVGTAGLVAHDHALAPVPVDAQCITEHRADVEAPPEYGAALRQAPRGHEHDCLGCHLSRLRVQLNLGTHSTAPNVEQPTALISNSGDVLAGARRTADARGPPRA